jgi:adenosylhomocysteine nucleosidase
LRILIIGAMEQEINAFLALMDDAATTQIRHITAYTGHYHGHDTLLAQSGIGKVNSAITSTLLINEFNPELALNIGSAGGVHESLSIGDIVVASELCYHDVDIRAFNYALGQVPGMPERFTPAPGILDAIQLIDHDRNIHSGLICSSDSFVSDPKRINELKELFPGIYAVDMESCSIAHVCHQFNVPFCIIRAISDLANDIASVNFDEFIETASVNSAELTFKMLEKLSGSH